MHGQTRLSACLPTESDNTPTEGGVNKLFGRYPSSQASLHLEAQPTVHVFSSWLFSGVVNLLHRSVWL